MGEVARGRAREIKQLSNYMKGDAYMKCDNSPFGRLRRCGVRDVGAKGHSLSIDDASKHDGQGGRGKDWHGC